jgi:hypothetical protein
MGTPRSGRSDRTAACHRGTTEMRIALADRIEQVLDVLERVSQAV